MSRAKASGVTTKSVTSSVKQGALSWKERLHPEDYEQLRLTFELFDEDGSGTIDPAEISKIMEELGDSRKGTLVHTIIQSLQIKDKPITFEEFVDYVAPKIGDVKTK